MKNENKPAFAISEEETDRIEGGINIYTGLTKREYFAAKAMQGLLSNPSQIVSTDFVWVAKHARGYADAALKELERTENH
jgi:hypothetical protein